jgi:predicted aspartyl protease
MRIAAPRFSLANTVAALLLAAGAAAAQQTVPRAPAGPLGIPLLSKGAEVVIPLRFEDGRILVPVTLDGIGESLFILDTAAGGSVISSEFRDRLDPGPEQTRNDSVYGASGATVMEYVEIPTLSLGGHPHEGLWAVVADIAPFRHYDDYSVQGILGVDVLARFGVEIDIPGGSLRLRPHGAPAPAWVRHDDPGIPFHSDAQHGFVQFTASVAGQPAASFLDTGARSSIVNWRAAALAGVGPDTEGLRPREEGSRGIDGNSVESFWFRFPDMRVGHAPIRREARIADLPVFQVLGIADGPVVLAGVDLIEACPIWIDYHASRFHLCAGSAGLSTQ